MSKEPIMQFREETLQKSLKWWKKKLFLNDWTIHAKLVSREELDDTNWAGQNEMTFQSKCSLIKIGIISDKERKQFIQKVCDEVTLVHELLHCKYNFMEGSGTYEQVYEDCIEHQKLEQMAKTLIMVKYNLPFSWFDNK